MKTVWVSERMTEKWLNSLLCWCKYYLYLLLTSCKSTTCRLRYGIWLRTRTKFSLNEWMDDDQRKCKIIFHIDSSSSSCSTKENSSLSLDPSPAARAKDRGWESWNINFSKVNHHLSDLSFYCPEGKRWDDDMNPVTFFDSLIMKDNWGLWCFFGCVTSLYVTCYIKPSLSPHNNNTYKKWKQKRLVQK